MGDYLANNPQFVVNGFRRAGISDALDGHRVDDSNSADKDEDPLSEDDFSAEDNDSTSEDEVVGSFSSDSDY